MPTILEAKDRVRSLSRKALEVVEDSVMTTSEKKAALDPLEADIKSWAEEVTTLTRFEESKKAFRAQAGDMGSTDDAPAAPAARNASRRFA